MPLPQLFLVGAPKAGTTALYAALRSHPEVFAPQVKEPSFFLGAQRGTGPGDGARARSHVTERRRYEALYDAAGPELRRLDGSALYLGDLEAHLRIAAAVPDAKVVAVLRDPVERAHSHWAHLRSDGVEEIPDLVAACAAEEERARRGWSRHWRYLGLGRYGDQLAHLLAVFDPSQVHLVRYADLVRAPVSTIDRTCTFLGLTPGIVGPLTAENVRPLVPDTARTRRWSATVRAGEALGGRLPARVWHPLRRPLLGALRRDAAPRPPLDPAARRELLAPLLADIEQVERLTGWDLAEWRDDRGRGSYPQRATAANAPR